MKQWKIEKEESTKIWLADSINFRKINAEFSTPAWKVHLRTITGTHWVFLSEENFFGPYECERPKNYYNQASSEDE